MAKCAVPTCNNFNKELSAAEILDFGGQRVCGGCWLPVDGVSATMATPPAPPTPVAPEPTLPTPDTTKQAEPVEQNWMSLDAFAHTFQNPSIDVIDTLKGAAPTIVDILQAPAIDTTDSPKTPTHTSREAALPITPAIPPQHQQIPNDAEGPFITFEVPTDFPELMVYQGEKQRGAPCKIVGDIFHIGRSSHHSPEPPDLDFRDFVDGRKVSRKHARIIQRNAQYFIEALSAHAHTWVNEDHVGVGELVPLHDGDIISIAGVADLEFVLPRP